METWDAVTTTISREGGVLVRRLVLAPGQATPWHVDRCRRLSVVVRGEGLRIEFSGGEAPVEVEVHAGLAGWDAPAPTVHRAVNTGRGVYEEVTVFWLGAEEEEPQPVAPGG